MLRNNSQIIKRLNYVYTKQDPDPDTRQLSAWV